MENLTKDIKTNLEKLKDMIKSNDNSIELINSIQESINEVHPLSENPINIVKWVDVDKIQANNYNPNTVATNELKLLYTSISHDGYTQPIVTIFDDKLKKYIIVDGFHRYFTLKSNKDLFEKNNGKVPIVVIKKEINDRMASTIRHNRARGKHSIDGMSNIVFNMLNNNWTDSQICNELGMEVEELQKLKHITGFSKLFEGVEYSNSWKTHRQIEIEKKYKEEKKFK